MPNSTINYSPITGSQTALPGLQFPSTQPSTQFDPTEFIKLAGLKQFKKPSEVMAGTGDVAKPMANKQNVYAILASILAGKTPISY